MIILIHSFADQDELLGLLEFCPKDVPIRILVGADVSIAHDLPVLALGLANVDVLGWSAGCLSDQHSVNRIFQGTAPLFGDGLETLQFFLSHLQPGGRYSILIGDRSSTDRNKVGAASSLLDCINKLSLWIAAGTSSLPTTSWWASVHWVQLQPGVATFALRPDPASDEPLLNAVNLFTEGHGCASEVIAEMQHELNRVFELYNTAYMQAQSSEVQMKELKRRLSHSQMISERYLKIVRRTMVALARLAAASAAQSSDQSSAA